MPDFSESVTIDAPPDRVFALVSDLPRMGEWSPECTRVTWSTGSSGPTVGARFIGHNRVGMFRWFTQGEITESAPGELLTFRIHFGPLPVALWSYAFSTAVSTDTEAGSGCVVTESWTDLRPGGLRQAMNRLFGDRRRLNQRGIRQTLANLKLAAESRP